MTYLLNFSDPTKSPFELADRDRDENTTSLVLTGRGAQNWGEPLQENLIHLLENFASPTPPINPIEGQFWYNNAPEAQEFSFWDGNEWRSSRSVSSGDGFPDSPEVGEQFFNDTEQALYVFDGSQWIEIAKISDLNAHTEDDIRHLSNAQRTLINGLTGISAATITDLEANVETRVRKAGDQMSGPLTLPGDPELDFHAATKSYVDSEVFRASRLASANGVAFLHHNSHTTFANTDQNTVALPFQYEQGMNTTWLFIGGTRQSTTAFTESTSTSLTLAETITADTEISVETFIFGTFNSPSTSGLGSITNFEHTESSGGNTRLTVPAYIPGSNNLVVFRDGTKRRIGVDYMEIDSTTIEFVRPLEQDDFIHISIFDFLGGASIRYETLMATENGQQVFELTNPYFRDEVDIINPLNQDVFVFTQGIYQGRESVAENAGSTVTLADGVPIGAVVEFMIFELT